MNNDMVNLYETIYDMFSENEKALLLVSLLEDTFQQDYEKIFEFLIDMKEIYQNFN